MELIMKVSTALMRNLTMISYLLAKIWTKRYKTAAEEVQKRGNLVIFAYL